MSRRLRSAWLLVVAGCASQAPELVPDVRLPTTAPRRSELVLRCVPSDAEVTLDGVPQGTCQDFDGDRGALGLGKRARVEVKKAGYAAWSSWMEADHTRVAMDVTLVPNGGLAP